jgi:hypothetical protein
MIVRRSLPILCMLLTACTPKHTDIGKNAHPQSDEPQMASMDVGSRVQSIQAGVDQLAKTTEQLPGSGGNEREFDMTNRQLMEKTFEGFAQILPLIEGQNQTGDFRQAMRVLETSRQQLANGSPDLVAEPTIAQGVRAVARLLASLNMYVFNNDPAITDKNDALQKTVDQLDVTHGVRSRVISGHAMREAVESLRLMSSNFAGRLAPASQPTTAPAATQPAK